MSDTLSELILSLTPEDGSSIGNGAMIARLQNHIPDLTRDAYAATRDALIDDGVLARGRGRGGSIYRADVADLTLTGPVASAPKSASGKIRKKTTRKSADPAEVLSYRHEDTRVNNPEVGMVHAETDPDQPQTEWQYDPHLDPELNFDSARAVAPTGPVRGPVREPAAAPGAGFLPPRKGLVKPAGGG